VISVVIATLNDAPRLTACLAPLVAAAMEGLVREVIIVDGGSTDATFEIADDAGAKFLRGEGDAAARIAEGARVAKGPWLLILDPRVRLEYGWETAALKHLNASKGAARFRLQKGEGGWLARLTPGRATALLRLKDGGMRSARPLDARGWLEG
jgi:glycosyltransferase involved in cell wall biosynthesis